MKTGITLEYRVNPSEVCGGVFVDEQQKFVRVDVGPIFTDPSGNFSLWEYFDTQLQTRASLLEVLPGEASEAWRIDEARAGDAGYYERHRVVAGTGRIACWRPLSASEQVPEPNVTHLDTPDSTEILPGDTFQVIADPSERNRLGTTVLATFSGAPFENSFESRVAPPSIVS